MQDHPIPQDVTGYKFHIVGNMTLKQFAEVGIGVMVAVILYNTNLLFFVKWPLIVLSVGLGGMMAFVPIEERPLDHWIVTFFRRLYNPTKFYWRKESTVPFAMTPEKTVVKQKEPQLEVDLTPARQQRIKDYLASVSQDKPLSEFEEAEKMRLGAVMQTFDDVSVEDVHAKPQVVKPTLVPRVRKLSPSQQAPAIKQTVFQAEPEIAIPEPTAITPSTAEPPPINPVTTAEPLTDETPTEVYTDEIPVPYSLPTAQAETNTKLPFPQKNTTPNMIMGMVLTGDDKLVDRATVTIKNRQGKVVGALRTNLLGQFFAATPLPSGVYALSIEKAGLNFPEQTLTLQGAPLEPLEVRAASA
jgi:hypothetical protein